ncbi:hypothetical protein BDR26DRAFT_939051 [Obelidium mucronatum]|nr:hypothetical protein BDR26DRAFT_939051 [Obelidium mucronatum]
MRTIGISLSPKPGHRLKVLKFDKETGAAELLVMEESLVFQAFNDMDGFYKMLQENQALEPDDIDIIKSVFKTQKIKFEQLMATGKLELTDESLKEDGIKQRGLRMAILAVIKLNGP